MGYQIEHRSVWALVRRQHGVVSRAQLLELGLRGHAIKHRLANGRLHLLYRGVYAVGRPEVTREGRWMAAVLACGPHAALSDEPAGIAWGIRPDRPVPIEISIPLSLTRKRPGIVIHRRRGLAADVTRLRGIPITTPLRTLIDLATRLSTKELEAAVNEADKLDLIGPDSLRRAVDERTGRAGTAPLRQLLDRTTFVLTDSELERAFLPIAARAGLPKPVSQRWLNGGRVDFYWPELGLVVETDGLRYHRTPAQQARDRRRDQANTAAGLTPLRFTHSQIRWEAGHVERTLRAVAARLPTR
jgi:very-short-patch-repair endonuclease